MILPLALLCLIPHLSWQRSPKHKSFWIYAQTAITSIALAVYFVDFGYYAYLESRVSTSIAQFFKNPLISFQMMWESYPLVAIMVAHFGLTYAIYKLLKKYAFKDFQSSHEYLKIRFAKGTAFFLIYAVGIHGSFSQYPLRWSEAFFSSNNFVSHLGLNPVHYLWDTYSNPDTDYDLDKVKKYYPYIAKYLGYNPEQELQYKRNTVSTPLLPKNMNVVYIVMESYAAYKMSLMGNIKGSSDTMDRLAEKGWFFKNFYTPTEGTARSMFCSLTGIPDINAKSTSSRNPRVVEQNTLINSFTNHEKYYFIGGSANWGNIRGIYENNIENLHMYEEDDYNKPKTDVWGLNDLDLFREAARALNERSSKKPFFAMIQAASFHRPYTIPDDHGDFKLKELSDSEMKKYGWKHNREFNSFRFSDYALGEFFRLIEGSEYYQNTLFVIHGDHGVSHFDAETLSKGYKQFYLSRFHVPLVFFSPQIKEPKVIQTMVSQVDVMTTIAGLFGIEAPHRSLCRNVFALNEDDKSYAFSYVYYDRPVTKMLYDQEYLAITDKSGEVSALYKYNEDVSANLIQSLPEKAKEMSDILHGFYESSRYLIQNNKKLDYKAGSIPN
jgi:phosphoglycerol transferase MdoB-like AlkP superfamily enzyme